MLDVPQTDQYQTLREVLADIDAVLIWPVMPTIPVQIVAFVQDAAEGAYVRQSNGPLRIEISETAEYPELTAVHEAAHYLDNCGFGRKQGWASEDHPHLEPLRRAWEKTKAVRALRRGLQTAHMDGLLPNGDVLNFPLGPEETENCRYYLQGRELFARSFAQYLAVKSGNRVLLHQVSQRRESVEGRFYHVQWTKSDFRVIAEAFDEIWGALGWLRL